MHQTRAEVIRKIPLPRKGTKYVARATGYLQNSVPVIIAIRDMMGLAKNAKEVKHLIQNKLVKLNGRLVRDTNESIKLFNILEVEKKYKLTLTLQGRYLFEETKTNDRICKIIGKKINKDKKTQLNLHDGTNIISNDKAKIQDSLELDTNNKIKKIIELNKGSQVLVMSGKSIGHKGKVINSEDGSAKIKLENGKEVVLEKGHIIAI